MTASAGQSGRESLANLQQFVRKPREPVEVCELCAKLLAHDHQHLLELEKNKVLCACDACAILFDGNARQRYRRIPREIERLKDFVMDDQEWNSLLIPINLAFFVRSSKAGRVVAQYPSPAGVMESLLDLGYWSAIEEQNPILQQMAPDVEALLVNRLDDQQHYYRVPIDRCFELVGIMRTKWRGLSGGSDVWEAIGRFFEELDQASGEEQIA